MITTEETQNKFCPFSSLAALIPISAGQYTSTGWYCRGDVCMMWRWEMGLFCLDKGRFLVRGESAAEPRSEIRPTNRGYCGLAGRPQ